MLLDNIIVKAQCIARGALHVITCMQSTYRTSRQASTLCSTAPQMEGAYTRVNSTVRNIHKKVSVQTRNYTRDVQCTLAVVYVDPVLCLWSYYAYLNLSWARYNMCKCITQKLTYYICHYTWG